MNLQIDAQLAYSTGGVGKPIIFPTEKKSFGHLQTRTFYIHTVFLGYLQLRVLKEFKGNEGHRDPIETPSFPLKAPCDLFHTFQSHSSSFLQYPGPNSTLLSARSMVVCETIL